MFLPKTVAEMLQKRFEEIENLKELFGEEYTDYNLVFASSCGRPIEGQVINRALKKLIDDNDLPPVVFHSFRHSSITYKLKLNGGDIKITSKEFVIEKGSQKIALLPYGFVW